MAGNIGVAPEQLSSVSAQLNGGAANIDGVLGQLSGQVAPLGSDWAGAGQVQFQSYDLALAASVARELRTVTGRRNARYGSR